MKFIIVISILISTLFAVSVDDVLWVLDGKPSIEQGRVEARHKGLPIVVVVIIKDGCVWCDLTVDKTLGEKEVEKAIAKNAVLVFYDFYKERPAAFKATHTPTFFFVDTQSGEILDRTEGFLEPYEFQNYLERAVNLQKRLRR